MLLMYLAGTSDASGGRGREREGGGRGDGLVEERLEDDDLVALLEEGHEGAQHACTVPVSGRGGRPETVAPSFAPVVMVTSLSGSRVRPKKGE